MIGQTFRNLRLNPAWNGGRRVLENSVLAAIPRLEGALLIGLMVFLILG